MAQTTIGGTKAPVKQETALPAEYRHSIVESRYIPHTSLLSFVPGTPTLVEYYRGFYGASEEQHAFAPESIETYQSYTRIRDLIVKIDNGNGNFNFVPENAQVTHQLTGYILFDLAPNKGDVFIKDIGDGRAGLYLITEQPEIRAITADKCYYFEATLETVMNQEIQDNLNSKIVKELFYSKESAVNGGNAVLSTTDRNLNQRLHELKFAITDDLLANNYYNDEDTVIVPNILGDRLYDPYLAKFLSYVIPAGEIAPRNRIRTMSVQYWVNNTKMQEPVTVWDMFYRNNFTDLQQYRQDYYVHPRGALINTRFYGNVFYSKMDRAITIHQDSANRNPMLYSGGLIPGPVPGTPVYPPMQGVKWDYFFDDAFFAGGGTEVQQFVWKMFRDKTIDKQGLINVLEGYWGLDALTRLYMGGIYLVAIKKSLITSSDYT